ncbi:MAG: hypothetical protein M1827_002458 [Pycnora praestabilis]|nr:MAG: hypothetical protein M1827_002458 [Pycnora praestabilis]
MSFFGFNSSLPRDRGHPATAPGFGQAPDPFAEVSRAGARNDEDDDDDDALDFEDTYDGLGDHLEETNDTFNDDTFGGGESGNAFQKPIGRDFDFSGQTAQVANAINEEQLRYTRQQPPPTSIVSGGPAKTGAKPTRTGYEKYKEPGYIPDLQANASLWGVAPRRTLPDFEGGQQRQENENMGNSQPSGTNASAKKMMSLEEVEAAMRAQTKKVPTDLGPHQSSQPSVPPTRQAQHGSQTTIPHQQPSLGLPRQLSTPHQQPPQILRKSQPQQVEPPSNGAQPPQILQRQQPLSAQPTVQQASAQPKQILQNPNRQSTQSLSRASEPELRVSEAVQPGHQIAPKSTAGPLHQTPLVTHPQQLLQLSEEDRAAFLIEDAKRAKRNHKIHLLSKDNGLMTPQDKNFITRIQLQQLVTATASSNEHVADATLSEDFYYQVHCQIRGGPRQNPHQPLSHFAQTYLFQTGGRIGGMAGRRQNRGSDNHMQRMEQQVQRAVEAAKLKPKNKQLVIEGSLGKISFSNAKTPKPLLNLKRAENGDVTNRPPTASRAHSERKTPQVGVSASDRKTILRNIENVYSTLMQMEDHERHLPTPPNEQSNAAEIQQHMEWRQAMQALNQKLWSELKVLEPIIPNSPIPHPFVAFLSHPKGKKAIPRIFRHIDQEQRVIVLTMIVVHLDLLDVIRLAQLHGGEQQLPTAVRDEVELFSQAVMPSLFGYVNDAPLNIIMGLLGLVLDRVNVQSIARTKVGLGIMTMFISRAELVKQAGAVDEAEWNNWSVLYDRLFDVLEPILGHIFPGSINSGEDMYVWQFLAAMGVGASPEQQQRLVIAVKDRVMETVMQSKTLPPDMASQKLGNVNLFMRAIGLDVELLG